MMGTKNLKFKVFQTEDGMEGVFEFSSSLEDKFDAIMEDLQGEHENVFVTPEGRERLMTECSRMVTEEPGFLDAYAHAAGALLENNEVDAAAIWYQRGLEQAYAAMKNEFKGLVLWGNVDNRPFLRLHHGHILCLIEQGHLKTAVKEMERHLKWNPNDNIGVRYMLADAYVAIGSETKARKLMKDKEHPSCHYNLALLDFKKGEYCGALTNLRRGFLKNPYIAEILLGNDDVLPKPMWIASSHEDIDEAMDYVTGIAAKAWTDDAIIFMNWAYNCSLALKDRAAWMEIREQLDTTHDFIKRGPLVEAMMRFETKITDANSSPAIRTIENRSGEEFPVWDLRAYR